MKNNISGKHAQINQLYKEMDKIYHEVAVHFQISDSVMMILYALCESNKVYTSKDICEEWSYSKQTVHSAIKKLEMDGYITLAAAADNKKNKLIILTSSGKNLVERTIVPIINAEKRALKRFSETEQEQIIALATKHVRVLQEEMDALMTGQKNE